MNIEHPSRIKTARELLEDQARASGTKVRFEVATARSAWTPRRRSQVVKKLESMLLHAQTLRDVASVNLERVTAERATLAQAGQDTYAANVGIKTWARELMRAERLIVRTAERVKTAALAGLTAAKPHVEEFDGATGLTQVVEAAEQDLYNDLGL